MAALGCGLMASLCLTNATQDANANGETRALSMVHSRTGETLNITYKRNGAFDTDALQKLNWFLRDWRVDEPTSMSPGLFDVVWHVYREVGASEPIKIMSAYRSPGTNAMLRRRSRAVAKESQHMRGNAMDVHIPGVSMAQAREIGIRLQMGGVGYYPSAGSPFVHLDVGSVRSWPRLSRDSLERIFPDGKTVHLPRDGTPLANYQAALAEVQARGGTALDYNTVTTTRGKGLWALLFGGSGEDEGADVEAPLAREPKGRKPPTAVAALAPNAAGDGSQLSPQAMAAMNDAARAQFGEAPQQKAGADAAPRGVEAGFAAQTEPSRNAANALAPPRAGEPALQIAALPVPPIRPGGAKPELMPLHDAPMPPIRPQGFARDLLAQQIIQSAAVSPSPLASSGGQGASGLPNAAGAPSTALAMVQAPLPPARPAGEALSLARPALAGLAVDGRQGQGQGQGQGQRQGQNQAPSSPEAPSGPGGSRSDPMSMLRSVALPQSTQAQPMHVEEAPASAVPLVFSPLVAHRTQNTRPARIAPIKPQAAVQRDIGTGLALSFDAAPAKAGFSGRMVGPLSPRFRFGL